MNDKKETVLLRSNHGLGDQMSLQIVVKHARLKYPDCKLIVEVPKGQQPLFQNLADEVDVCHYPLLRWGHLAYHDIKFAHPKGCYNNLPATKATVCCHEELRVNPIKELFHYEPPHITQETQDLADDFISGFDRPVVALHYEGKSRKQHKDLTHKEAGAICNLLIDRGFAPLILDWSWKNPLVDEERIFSPKDLYVGKETNISMLGALLKRCWFFIGIDSGPSHVLGGIKETIGIIIWKKLHPYHCYDLADNIHHLVPSNHWEYIEDHPKPNKHVNGRLCYFWDYWDNGCDWFVNNYQYDEYENLLDTVERTIDQLTTRGKYGFTSRVYGKTS